MASSPPEDNLDWLFRLVVAAIEHYTELVDAATPNMVKCYVRVYLCPAMEEERLMGCVQAALKRTVMYGLAKAEGGKYSFIRPCPIPVRVRRR